MLFVSVRIVIEKLTFGSYQHQIRTSRIAVKKVSLEKIYISELMEPNFVFRRFVNGVKMETKGADFTASYNMDTGSAGTIDWSFVANYNANKVLGINPLPGALYVNKADPRRSALINRYSVVQLENSTPKVRATLGAFWKLDRFSINIRESYYSRVYALETTPGNSPLKGADIQVPVNAAFITDLEAGIQVSPGLKVAAGANNLFDHYPTERSYTNIRQPQLVAGSRSFSSNLYPTISPYGINGGFYYVKATYTF